MRLAIYLLLPVLLSCNNTSIKEIKNFSVSETPLELTKGVTMYYSDMGNSKMKLISPEVYRYTINNEMILECPEGLEITYYDTMQNIESVMLANYGKFYSKREYMIVKDNVVFYNKNKDTLFTNLLHIYFAKDSIYTDSWVKIASENGIISGSELQANSNFTFYKLMNIKNSHIQYEDKE
jgi:LPS export ABC transporter protein LptC